MMDIIIANRFSTKSLIKPNSLFECVQTLTEFIQLKSPKFEMQTFEMIAEQWENWILHKIITSFWRIKKHSLFEYQVIFSKY